MKSNSAVLKDSVLTKIFPGSGLRRCPLAPEGESPDCKGKGF